MSAGTSARVPGEGVRGRMGSSSHPPALSLLLLRSQGHVLSLQANSPIASLPLCSHPDPSPPARAVTPRT